MESPLPPDRPVHRIVCALTVSHAMLVVTSHPTLTKDHDMFAPTVSPSQPCQRLNVRFDTDRTIATVPQGPNKGKRFGTVTHYSERPGTTPTGGKFTRRGFTLRLAGRTWYGTLSKDHAPDTIVRCRLASK